MYLSRLFLNPLSRQVWSELADRYQLHRTVMHAFPSSLQSDERVLFRLEENSHTGTIYILVQSLYKPDWSFLQMDGKDYLASENQCPVDAIPLTVKQFNLQLANHAHYRFRLTANPTKKQKIEGKKQGKRIGLYNEEKQIEWLKRKIETSGGKLISVRTDERKEVYSRLNRRKNDAKAKFISVCFDGVLQVQNGANFAQAVKDGFGSGKGFGFGLLTLARI